MRILQGHRHAVRVVAYSPGEPSLLVSAGDDRTVRLWDPATGQEQGVLDGHPDSLCAIAFTTDGALMATGGRSGSLVLWDFPLRTAEWKKFAQEGPVIALGFTADRTQLHSAHRSPTYNVVDQRLRYWAVDPFVATLGAYHWTGVLLSAALSADGSTYALSGEGNGLELWRPGEPRQPAFAPMPSQVRVLAFSPGQGRYLAAASGRFIELWDVAGRQRVSICQGHRNIVQAVCFGPCGRWLLSTAGDRTVRQWDVLTGRQLALWDWEVGGLSALAVAPDGMTAAAGGEKASVIVWDIEG